MMPPPVHLAGLVVPDDPWIDEEPLNGLLKCVCGCSRFALLYVGTLQTTSGRSLIGYTKVDGHSFFVIRARCGKCETRYTLYDKDYHGWNGFVASEPADRKRPRPPDSEFVCPGCGGNLHRVRLSVIAAGSTDFIAEAMDGGDDRSRFTASDWPNAFGSISFDITCIRCELETKDWAGEEAQ